MPRGKIVWYNETRGFGLLRERGTEREYYVIHTDVEDEALLAPGREVAFEPGKRGEADVARNVRFTGSDETREA